MDLLGEGALCTSLTCRAPEVLQCILYPNTEVGVNTAQGIRAVNTEFVQN